MTLILNLISHSGWMGSIVLHIKIKFRINVILTKNYFEFLISLKIVSQYDVNSEFD